MKNNNKLKDWLPITPLPVSQNPLVNGAAANYSGGPINNES